MRAGRTIYVPGIRTYHGTQKGDSGGKQGTRNDQHEAIRYNERSVVERVNGRLKDEFGGRFVRVKGDVKVMCHLMFGILALTADQLMRMIQ